MHLFRLRARQTSTVDGVDALVGRDATVHDEGNRPRCQFYLGLNIKSASTYRLGRDPQGIEFGDNVTLMSSRGLARFGELYRNGGCARYPRAESHISKPHFLLTDYDYIAPAAQKGNAVINPTGDEA